MNEPSGPPYLGMLLDTRRETNLSHVIKDTNYTLLDFKDFPGSSLLNTIFAV